MLSAENVKTIANFSQILSLVGFFCSAYIYTTEQ